MSQSSMISNGIFSETDKDIGMSCGTNVALASPDPLCVVCVGNLLRVGIKI